MNRLHLYSPPVTMSDDSRLRELFVEAERLRKRRMLKIAVTWLSIAVLCGTAWYVILRAL